MDYDLRCILLGLSIPIALKSGLARGRVALL